jgi:hypothetical protein
VIENVSPTVRPYPPRSEPYEPPADEHAIMCEIRALIAAAGAAPKPIIVHAVDDGGGHHAFVSWPKRGGDRSFDELIAAASVAIDYEIVGAEPAEADAEVEAALIAAAAQSEKRRRQALTEERRRVAEEHFSAIEQQALARWRARRQHEVFVRYISARLAAARRRHAAKAARR